MIHKIHLHTLPFLFCKSDEKEKSTMETISFTEERRIFITWFTFGKIDKRDMIFVIKLTNNSKMSVKLYNKKMHGIF